MHTEQQIEQWARECIAEDWTDHIPGYYRDMNLTRFAALVAQSERERCAKLCDALSFGVQMITVREDGFLDPRQRDRKAEQWFSSGATNCAAAIRNSDGSKG